MTRSRVVVFAWLPEGVFETLAGQHPDFDWLDARTPAAAQRHLAGATIAAGLPPLERLADMTDLKWIQLFSAGVPRELCGPANASNIIVTNLAGLHGPSIAEHAFGLLFVLARGYHVAMRQQLQSHWDRSGANRLFDLRGRTLGIIGLGDIGRAVARLGRACGMRIVGCRRREGIVPEVDRIYPLSDLHAMLAESDALVVAAPLTPQTEGMLGPAEFAALKEGALYVNVSRGPIAREEALVEALRKGRLGGAGLDVFATEPLPAGHPLWTMPNVVIVPHLAGEPTNLSTRPAERLSRNLGAWRQGQPLEGRVDLESGY